MIAGEVRENGDVVRNAVNALLLQRMRRHFHHGFGAAGLERASEELVQFQRLGRGVRRGKALVFDAIFNRADERSLASTGPQHRIQQE